MSQSKASQFFLTDTGKSVSLYFMAICSASAFGSTVYFHTLGLEKWKNTFQLYKYGFATALTPNVIARTQEVMTDVEMTERTKKFLKFFTVYGFDVFHAGSTKLRFGALIGLPRNFSYQSVSNIEKSDIIIENRGVEWGSEDGNLLQGALILSENAQKFAIAREIYMSDTNYVYTMGFIHSVSIAMTYGLSAYANQRTLGLYKPRSFRIVLYSLVGTFMYGVWSTTKDIFTKVYENYGDRKAGALGKKYAEGGVEFYAKILQRNIALKALMGTNGEKLYTAFGNDVEIIRQRHVPYTVRKDNLIKTLSNYNTAA